MTRHTCIVCKRKRYSKNMISVIRKSWACADTDCFLNENIEIGKKILSLYEKLDKRILNKSHLFVK